MESRNVMKKYIGILAKITGFILIVILAVNIILPLIKRNPDAAYEKELEQTTFTEETMKDVGGNQAGKKNAERIRCIDDNEEALLWRLRMIGNAKKVLCYPHLICVRMTVVRRSLRHCIRRQKGVCRYRY